MTTFADAFDQQRYNLCQKSDHWVLKTLSSGQVDEPTGLYCLTIAPKELISTRNAVAVAKKELTDTSRIGGSYHTHIRALVMCNGPDISRSFQVCSPELFVSCDRNLRKLSNSKNT